MIPLKLQLKNFLSYGANLQTIDFSPYHLICLSGKNGHGKSALLDAITWALWGQARKISGIAKADTHLLRLGQQQMLVILDFEFNRQHYRIRREFALTHGKQYASLDFALIEADKTISLTNKTIRETQATIETTLGLDFESFINSAFLRQGQSNEFSKKSPKERKDILGTILGLNHYELLKKRALDKVKNATNEIVHLSKFQEKLQQELHRLPELTTTLLTVNQSISILEEHEKLCITQKASLLDKKNQLQAEKNQQEIISLHIKNKKEEITKHTVTLQQLYTEWRVLHKKYLLYSPLVDHDERKQNLIAQITKHQNEQQKYLLLKEKELNLKQQEQELVIKIKAEHSKKVQHGHVELIQVQTDLIHKKNQLESLDKQNKLLLHELNTIKNEKVLLQQELTTLRTIHEELHKLERIFEKRRTLYLQWDSELKRIQTESNELTQKQQLTSDETNPSCPLCEQNLSASRKKFLKSHFIKKEQFLHHRLQRLTTLLDSLKHDLINNRETLRELKLKSEQFTLVEIKHKELIKSEEKKEHEYQKCLEECNSFMLEYEIVEKKLLEKQRAYTTALDEEQTILETDKEYQVLSALQKKIGNEQSSIHYNEKELISLRNQLAALEELMRQAIIIEQEINKKKSLAVTISEQCKIIKNLKAMLNDLLTKKSNFESLEAHMQQLLTLESTIEQTAQKYQKEKELLLQQRGSLEKEQMTLSKYELEFKAQDIKIKEFQELSYDYQTIANALGKDGIQALIIEDALPEIEQEANDLLGQLTDNQAHIIIDSLRDLKKGGTKETLDIKISDSIGIRPYELFSGGEAFRIDFALRLAISKLLARRAGTSLQTLIIDEGFGSQDEDGLAHIMDALYKIQNNFCKIIIVSHLPSMKDQFPVHFFVEKGSQGSSLRVIEQG